MELDDCAFPLLAGIVQTDDPNVAFGDVELRPARRLPPPHRRAWSASDLLEANGAIFTVQGKALSDNAAGDVRVLVVGNPANTNCLIAMNNAPDIPDDRFTAMTRLDHNRAMAQLAAQADVTVNDVTNMTIWGNHSATQYPDLFHAEVDGTQRRRASSATRPGSRATSSPPCSSAAPPSSRPAACRSAASAANAAIDHVRDWALGTPDGDWVSMAIPSDGSYGVPEGLISSFPVTCTGGTYEVDRQGLEHRRLLPGPHRRLRGRAGRGARRGARASASSELPVTYALDWEGQARSVVVAERVEIDVRVTHAGQLLVVRESDAPRRHAGARST